LKNKGATDIVVSDIWPDSDRDNTSYDVSYTDTKGVKHQTVCKAQGSFLRSQELFWRDPPEV
jgi:hypothetical protein